MILVKVDVDKNLASEADLTLNLASSEVVFLTPGQTSRGNVANLEFTQKIYEVYINQLS
jgi:hypothetical protein